MKILKYILIAIIIIPIIAFAPMIGMACVIGLIILCILSLLGIEISDGKTLVIVSIIIGIVIIGIYLLIKGIN
jgi:hypothetical protein